MVTVSPQKNPIENPKVNLGKFKVIQDYVGDDL